MPLKIIPTFLSTSVSKSAKKIKSMTVSNIFMKSLELQLKLLRSPWNESTLSCIKDFIKIKSTLINKWRITSKLSKFLIIQFKYAKSPNLKKPGKPCLILLSNSTISLLILIFLKTKSKSSSLSMEKSWNILPLIVKFHTQLTSCKTNIKTLIWEVKWPKLSLPSLPISHIPSISCSSQKVWSKKLINLFWHKITSIEFQDLEVKKLVDHASLVSWNEKNQSIFIVITHIIINAS